MRIRQQVYWYWYSPLKMLFGIKESLCKTTRQNTLQLDENLITFADQVFNKMGYKKEIYRILGSEWFRKQNIAQKNLLFLVTAYSLNTLKVTNKE